MNLHKNPKPKPENLDPGVGGLRIKLHGLDSRSKNKNNNTTNHKSHNNNASNNTIRILA